MISIYQKAFLLSVKYSILSYLPGGLSANSSYIQRKAYITSFNIYFIMKAQFFFIKINNSYKFYKIY